MLTPNFSQCISLTEFYNHACECFIKEYGSDFVLYYQHIQKLIPECQSYKELGVLSGVSAAAAWVGNPSLNHLELVDINFDTISPHRHLFEQECGNRVVFNHNSSIDPDVPVSTVDMLMVDSMHTYRHVRAELELHAPNVKKYIVFHDAKHPPVKQAIDEFLSRNEWEYVIYDDRSFGYAIIQRK
jgi:cephalosporin hydroxylase